MNTYPVGNIVECVFAFSNRQLTPTETQTFLAGGGLPAGAGVDQADVGFQYRVDKGPAATLNGDAIVHDGEGAYHANITTLEPGTYKYRAYSLDGSGNPVAATQAQWFVVTAF